jgi:microcystin-dependent protein
VSQAADLGQIANQAGGLYRARVNANLQALASYHSGSSEPAPAYPNMLWFDQGSGLIRLRDPTNTAWSTVGTIGPPMKWTAVDVPSDGFTTGDLKPTFKTVADPGWLMMNDGSIGNAGSGASTRAHADCQALFALLWTNVGSAYAPLQDAAGAPVSRGASAASDWAALRRLMLPKVLGRALAIAGWGSGLTARPLGEALGEEAHALSAAEEAPHTHGAGTLTAASAGAHTHTVPVGSGNSEYGSAQIQRVTWSHSQNVTSGSSGAHTHALSGSTASAGSAQPHNTMQPSVFLNVMIKL